MSEGALGIIQRVVVGKENGSIYTAPSAFTAPRGIEEVSASAKRELLPDNRQKTSRRAGHASHLGPKSWELGFKAPLHAATQTDLDPILENVAGAAAGTGSAITATGTTTVVTKTAGDFLAPCLLLTTASGKEVRPIKSVSSNDATLAIRGSAASSAAENPAFFYTGTPTGAETTLAAEWDRHSESDVVNYEAQGGVCDRLALEIDTEGRVALDVHLMGADWSQDDTPDNIASPSTLSGHFLGYAAEVFLQDIGTPAAGTQIDMHALSVNLAPQWIARKATRAVGSGSVPGSAVAGWKRGVWFGEPIKLTVTKAAASYVTAITARTAYGLLVSFAAGGPGASTTDVRMALWVPRVVIADAQPVDIDGIEGMELTLEVEEEALTAPYLAPWFLSFFA
jgi:hypothetical protein